MQRANRQTLLAHEKVEIARQAKPLLAYTLAFALLAVPVGVYVVWAEINLARNHGQQAKQVEDWMRSSCFILLAARGKL